MPARIPAAFRVTRAQTWVTRAGASALLRLYTGTQPASADDAASGTLLGTYTCGATLGTVDGNGLLTFGALTGGNAVADGTAGWARLVTADGTTVVGDFDVTATGGGGTLQMNNPVVTSGQPLASQAITLNEWGAA